MSNDEFTKLFKYMTERFDRIDQALGERASKEDMQRVFGVQVLKGRTFNREGKNR